MADYNYQVVINGDSNSFGAALDEVCKNGRGRVVASNAYWDQEKAQTMYYGLVQVFSYGSDNPDKQLLDKLNAIEIALR